MLRNDILPPEVQATGFKVPERYYLLFEIGATSFYPWFFLPLSMSSGHYERLRERFPDHLLVPFAGHMNYVACFVAQSSEYPRMPSS